MSELRIETLSVPAADLGPENPLPPLKAGRDVHVLREPVPGVSEEMLRNMAYGRVPNILPYTMQDGYTRQRRIRDLPVAVLENEVLRATFLLTYGGRLWSLLHKPSGRDLLDVNPVFQPANLALRNAWFSGGVEWNIGTTGHSPFTCSPLFAARLTTPEGAPVLRLYEWERIRQVPFQIDAYLPDGSPVLFVAIRIVNPHAHTVPMYWWSNTAVPETSETRVLVPAETAYSFGYGGGGLARVDIPEIKGVDISYPTHINRAADFFFHIPDGERPWITALDGEGRGLIQTSTARLKGRKLFLWGMGEGGRRWQTFLAELGHAYIEIQAGLARTQLEHIPMAGGAEWTWLEAYGPMEADPRVVHGSDWDAAVAEVKGRLATLLDRQQLDAALARCLRWLDQPPEVLIQRGSGWGALERIRRAAAGEPPFAGPALIFDDAALSAAQAPWLALLEGGAMPAPDPDVPPHGYMVQEAWRDRLAASVASDSASWLAWYHLGVMHYATGNRDGARDAWQRALTSAPNAWAARNLALLAFEEERFDAATAYYRQALKMQPALLPLAIEVGRRLLAMARPQVWLDLLEDLPAAVRSSGRVRLLEGQAAVETGALARVADLFDGSLVVEDLREGERSLSELWIAYHAARLSREEQVPVDDALRARVREAYPVPDFLDFRMSEGKG
jgi:tetratricopeptide (TPR) repeat protein